MTTTERAAKKLRDILTQKCSDIGLGFRVKNSTDESGHAVFSIEVDKECPGDVVIKSNGVKVLLDKESAAVLGEYELDYLGEPDGGFSLKVQKKPTKPLVEPDTNINCYKR